MLADWRQLDDGGGSLAAMAFLLNLLFYPLQRRRRR
jgi:hypothetical protein